MLHALGMILGAAVIGWGLVGFCRSIWRPPRRRGHEAGEASAINGVGGGWPAEHHHSPSHEASGGDGGSSH